jgi:hypothetical protein
VTIVLVAAGVLLVVLIWALLARRRRPSDAGITRDAPTVGADALGGGMAPTRLALGERLTSLFGKGVPAAVWDELEDALLAADVGVQATAAVVAKVRESSPSDPDGVRTALRRELLGIFEGRDVPPPFWVPRTLSGRLQRSS